MKSMVDIRHTLRAEIAEQMQGTADKLAAGTCKDYAEYRQAVGRIAGGRDALDAVDAVFHKLVSDDEGD